MITRMDGGMDGSNGGYVVCWLSWRYGDEEMFLDAKLSSRNGWKPIYIMLCRRIGFIFIPRYLSAPPPSQNIFHLMSRILRSLIRSGHMVTEETISRPSKLSGNFD